MDHFPPRQMHFPPAARRGFTLVEMLAVMSIIVVLLSLVVPVVVQVGAARTLTKGAYDITETLEQARAYAKANSTYTWVGFYEQAEDHSAGAAAYGQVLVSMVASKDGSTVYTNSASNPSALAPTNLVQIGKLVKIDNAHLDILNNVTMPSRDSVPGTNYQVGSSDFTAAVANLPPSSASAPTTFNYPTLGTTGQTGVYTFSKIIQFGPLGDATRLGDTPTEIMEVGLRPTHGSVPDANAKNFAAVQVSGIGGQVRLYQP